MKVKQNGAWKNLGGIDVGKFGKYTLLTPDMVSGEIGSTNQRYTGTATRLIIDDSFPTNNLQNLFYGNSVVESVIILKDSVTSMQGLFESTSKLNYIFANTSNVTNMYRMFYNSKALELDLSSFDTSNVISMSMMFGWSQATTLDLSSFDTSNVTNIFNMFYSSKAGIGYARTQADADRFNASPNKPSGLTFIVKP